ncbi:MAG: hypothetical protein DHS20C14_01710 [Phycisphaeraceae bacterium]|nr:MAG: hypothetical protein DHS20C14_01710 [Phycisphaeraceae bacterium]
MLRLLLIACLLPTLGACARTLPAYPHPISNNAVTSVLHGDGTATVYSFMGIVDPADTDTITPAAYALDWPGADAWRRIADVPLDEGKARIAASAVSIDGRVFVVGGYSVLDDGAERTDPRLLEYLVGEDRWIERAPPPVEVDDTLAVVWRGRYLYLVSGWHGPAHDNVLDVQVWDVASDVWRACTPMPGPGSGLFGHAGGILGGKIIVLGGVGRDVISRKFVAARFVYHGEIDPENPTRIHWSPPEEMAGIGRYRAANSQPAVGETTLVILGGTETPYNIDGVGYDDRSGPPPIDAEPLATVLIYDTESWSPRYMDAEHATMDHRGLVRVPGGWAVVGGMTAAKTATDRVTVYRPHRWRGKTHFQ